MANAIWSKNGVDFKETPDTPEFSETAKTKGYKRYYDITKDDKDVKTIPEDMLETAKAKGYRLFGQPPIEQKPVETSTKTAPTAKEKPAEEPGLVEQAADWVGRTAKAGVKSLAGIPAGAYELGKEVLTQPQEAIPAALTGTAKTFGVEKVAGALRGGYEAGKSLLGLGGVEAELEGGDLGEAYKRGYEAEVSGLGERAKRAKDVSPAAYAAGPYAATAAITGGAGLPATLAAETATGAAQQYAETGKIDTAELAGQTLAGLGLTKGVQKTGQLVERVSPVKVTQTGREAAAGRLEEAAIRQAQEKSAIGDIAKKYTGEEGAAKIQEAKRAGFDVGQAKAESKKLLNKVDREAATAMGDELRDMLNRMDSIQKEAYDSVKSAAKQDTSVLNTVDESVTAKAITDVEQSLNSIYAMDDITREKLQDIKMSVNPKYQTEPVTRGKDFESLIDLRKAVDSIYKDAEDQIQANRDLGKGAPPELVKKQAALLDARQKIQQSLYGQEAPFSPELKSLGEAADQTYADFTQAKGKLQQKKILTREKGVFGAKPEIAPSTDIIKRYFKEPDLGRKNQIKKTLKDMGVNVERLDVLENMRNRGVLSEDVAAKQVLAQEYKALGGKTAFDSQGLADIADKRGLISRGLEYAGEKIGVGLTPMQLLEKAAEVRGSRSLIEKVQAVFPDNPALNTAVKSIVNTGTKITPALIRAVARKSNVDEEKLAKAIVESQTP